MRKTLINKTVFYKIFLLTVITVICVLIIRYFDYIYSLYIVIAIALLSLVSHLLNLYNTEKWLFISNKVLNNIKTELSTYVDTVNIPTVITNKSGVIKWQSPSFVSLLNRSARNMKISSVIKDIDKPVKDRLVTVGGLEFTKEVHSQNIDGRIYKLYRLIDKKTNVVTSDVYRQHLSVVGIIQVDNFYDISSVKGSISKAEVTLSIEKELNQYIAPINGMLKKTDADKYIVIFERKYLAGLIHNKFSILDKVSSIDIDGAQPTISIAIGVSDNIDQSYLSAQKALEFAIGRGGNQAVVKRKDKFSFFGGPKGSIVRSTKVKSRIVAKNLRSLMQQSDKVIIMGHKTPDFDSLGSAMGMVCCARSLNKKSYLVIEPPTASLDAFIDEIRNKEEYRETIVSASDALMQITPSSLVIVVDTQVESLAASSEIVKISENTVVIDHHLRGRINIKDATLYYHEPFASSTSELVTEIIQYFGDTTSLIQIEAEALLSGIIVDTKNFSFKTGVRTFEAASYLRKYGADTTVVKKHFKDDYKTFISKSEVVQSRQVIFDNIALSMCPKGMDNARLVAAQAADVLVSIIGIKTSYVFSYLGDDILISGRSIEGQNVQLVLERIGGGGHSTIAAARLTGMSFDEAKEKLIESIKKEMD